MLSILALPRGRAQSMIAGVALAILMLNYDRSSSGSADRVLFCSSDDFPGA